MLGHADIDRLGLLTMLLAEIDIRDRRRMDDGMRFDLFEQLHQFFGILQVQSMETNGVFGRKMVLPDDAVDIPLFFRLHDDAPADESAGAGDQQFFCQSILPQFNGLSIGAGAPITAQRFWQGRAVQQTT